MLERVSLVHFRTRFYESAYSFDENDWAKCLLYMAEHFDEMEVPIQRGQNDLF